MDNQKKLKTFLTFTKKDDGIDAKLQFDQDANLHVNDKKVVTTEVVQLRWFMQITSQLLK